MIPAGWVDETNLHKLTRAEACAFVYFILCEKRRHEKDITEIRDMVTNVCKHFGIKDLKLSAIYSDVYGSNQSSGVTGQ